MHSAYVITVFLHILAAMVWIGGAAFLALILVPVVRRPEFTGLAPSLLRAAALRFRLVGWICLGILIVTGCANLGFRGYSFADCLDGRLWQGDFGRLLSVKMSLVGAMLAISGLHDFLLGPQAARILLESPGSSEAKAARKRAAWMGRSVLLLAILVAGVAVLLVRGSF
jgi:copper resistance protein D